MALPRIALGGVKPYCSIESSSHVNLGTGFNFKVFCSYVSHGLLIYLHFPYLHTGLTIFSTPDRVQWC